jgi:CheY-like chemotaxis protein
LATDNALDVFTFWGYHKQCGIKNPVELVSDGEDVLRFLATTRHNYPCPALVVLSLRMPRMGALQVLHQLAETRQTNFHTVLLIDHQDHDLPLVAAAFKLQVEAFLHRPIAKKDFCHVLSLFGDTVKTGLILEPELKTDTRFIRPDSFC